MLTKDGFLYPEGATQQNLRILTPTTEVKRKEEKNAEIARWVERTTNGVIGVTGVTGANDATDIILPPIDPPVLSLNPSEFARRLNEEVEKERKEMEQQKCVEITRAIEEIQPVAQRQERVIGTLALLWYFVMVDVM